MTSVTVLAFNNCLTSSVVGIMDVLAVSNRFVDEKVHKTPLFNIQIAAIKPTPVKSFNAVPIQPDITIDAISTTDIIVIPPMMDDFEKVLSDNRAVIPWIKSQHKNGALVCSVCTGIFFLAEAELLNGRKATSNPMIKCMLSYKYPNIRLTVDEILIDLGDVITAGSTYAFVDLIVYILEKNYGVDIARQTSKLFLHDKNRKSQSSYLSSPFNKQHQDLEILGIQTWLDTHYTTKFPISFLAGKCSMSLRNFLRRFQEATGETPSTYIQLLRIELAKKTLESSNKNINEIVYDVGYADQKSFGPLI